MPRNERESEPFVGRPLLAAVQVPYTAVRGFPHIPLVSLRLYADTLDHTKSVSGPAILMVSEPPSVCWEGRKSILRLERGKILEHEAENNPNKYHNRKSFAHHFVSEVGNGFTAYR